VSRRPDFPARRADRMSWLSRSAAHRSSVEISTSLICRQRGDDPRRLPISWLLQVIAGNRARRIATRAGEKMSGLLTQDQLLQAVGQVAETALPRWGLAGAALKRINHSENTTYLVTPKNGSRPVILRVHREGYHSVNGIRSELAWMRALQAEAGVLTPQAIPGQDGQDIQSVSHPT